MYVHIYGRMGTQLKNAKILLSLFFPGISRSRSSYKTTSKTTVGDIRIVVAAFEEVVVTTMTFIVRFVVASPPPPPPFVYIEFWYILSFLSQCCLCCFWLVSWLVADGVVCWNTDIVNGAKYHSGMTNAKNSSHFSI